MAFYIESGSTYIIINNRSGTILDLSVAMVPNTVHGWHRHNQPNQRWIVTYAGQGWHFKNVWDGKYLAHDGAAQNGSLTVVRDQPFLWNIWPDTQVTTAARITVPGSTLDVDLDSGRSTDGTIIHLWDRHTEGQQVWRFEKI